ncbi:MAG: lytic transglycosylase domain-containing protein [Chlorobi bacterium CHB2]|nr:lytic transglycosylase domain-containing protein [Chlorobi bacterium CHB2]
MELGKCHGLAIVRMWRCRVSFQLRSRFRCGVRTGKGNATNGFGRKPTEPDCRQARQAAPEHKGPPTPMNMMNTNQMTFPIYRLLCCGLLLPLLSVGKVAAQHVPQEFGNLWLEVMKNSASAPVTGGSRSAPLAEETHPVRKPSAPAPLRFSTAIDKETQALGVVTAAWRGMMPGTEYHRILNSPNRAPLLAAPFGLKGKNGTVRVAWQGIDDPTIGRQYASDSTLESLVEWYRGTYGIPFTVRTVALADSATGGRLTIARGVHRIGNTIVSVMIWNPTVGHSGKRGSKRTNYLQKTSIAVQERAFRSRDFLVAEGPDAVVELTWQVPYGDAIQRMSQKYEIDPFLIAALVQQESNFNAGAISVDSAMGLTQMIPTTAEAMGVTDPADPHQSLEGGVRYLKLMLRQFNGNVMLALAAYNAGPGNVMKYRGIPPFPETRTYVRRIMDRYKEKAGKG